LSHGSVDLPNVIVTVADADSEFGAGYFENVTRGFVTLPEEERHLRIWQAPVFHLKNYHRQPGPVLVGTMFTCMQELAALNDPNAVRLPYSTYSLSLSLVRRVGGWDAEWIAEDWHMGIKCFLMTLGRSIVEPIFSPTMNYTPEAETWLATVHARWVQAKRHALGFSDMTYYFMMLPLLFGHAASKGSNLQSLQQFWRMATYGITVLIKLVNVHVVIGLLTTYGLVTALLRVVMLAMMSEDRYISQLFSRTSYCAAMLVNSSAACTASVSIMFIVLYNLMVSRIEDRPVTRSSIIHFVRNACAIIITGPFYALGLGACAWMAALNVLSSRPMEYEVAPKPTSAPAAAAPGPRPKST